MKITILKENLKNGLNIVEKITGKNLTLPILNNVLISTDKNFLNLSTTDLEIGIKYWTLSKIEKQGNIAVPAKLLSDFITSLSDEKVNLEVKNNFLFIESKNQKARIKTFNSEEFPIIPVVKTENFIEIEAPILFQGLSYVKDFCSANQIRPELSGVYFQIQTNEIKLAATDSFRLAEKTLYSKNKQQEYSFILPQKTTRELLNVLSEKFFDYLQKSKIKIYFSPNQILFEFPMQDNNSPCPQIKIVSRLVEGEFPDYQEIIPKKYETQVILNKDSFLDQIKTASLFCGKINEVKIKVDIEKKQINIFSQNPELGENRSYIAAKIKGKPVEVAFNYKFLIDGLLNIKSKEIIFELNNEDGPAVLKPVGDPSYIYVIMPIKA